MGKIESSREHLRLDTSPLIALYFLTEYVRYEGPPDLATVVDWSQSPDAVTEAWRWCANAATMRWFLGVAGASARPYEIGCGGDPHESRDPTFCRRCIYALREAFPNVSTVWLVEQMRGRE